MSSFFSPKYLKYADARCAGTIETDMFCSGCGYNLRGLRQVQSCPECGALNDTGPADALIAGSYEDKQRRRLGLSLTVATLGAVVVVEILFTVLWLATSLAVYEIVTVLGMVVSLGWIAATWMLTGAIDDRFSWAGTVRVLVRLSQPLWLVGFALSGSAHVQATLTPNAVLLKTSLAVRSLAFIGAMLFAWALLQLASDAHREDAERRLRRVLFGLPIMTTVIAFWPGSFLWIVLPFYVAFLAGWLYFMWAFVLAVIELSAHVNWVLNRHQDATGRMARIEAARREMTEQAEQVIRPVSRAIPEQIPYDE